MNYLSTADRNPGSTLGSWIKNSLKCPEEIKSVRIQSGYFEAQPLAYLEETLDHLARTNGLARFLIGSNDGSTRRSAVESLLQTAGASRTNLGIAVVNYSRGLFHPKVLHFEREDGTSTAYVGSANLTHAGVSGLNIESGITLDTHHGDSERVLDEIAQSIDQWFETPKPGAYQISSNADLDNLVARGILDTQPAVRRPPKTGHVNQSPSLKPLTRVPSAGPQTTQIDVAIPPQETVLRLPSGVIDGWSKILPKSDAQKKASGNQSGVIALTQASRRHEIDQTTYFREVLFGQLFWRKEVTRTGFPKDIAQVPMHTTILGEELGVITYTISHDPLRERKQNNYTTTLHLDPIREYFSIHDMTNKTAEISLDSNGNYWFTLR